MWGGRDCQQKTTFQGFSQARENTKPAFSPFRIRGTREGYQDKPLFLPKWQQGMEGKGSHRKLMPFWKKTISGPQNLRVLEPYENISICMLTVIFFLGGVLRWVFTVARRLCLVTRGPSLVVAHRLSCLRPVGS